MGTHETSKWYNRRSRQAGKTQADGKGETTGGRIQEIQKQLSEDLKQQMEHNYQ